MANFKILNLLLLMIWSVSSAPADYDDYSDEVTDEPHLTCDAANCKRPNCSCFGVLPDVPLGSRPQFVMLTFDDAITVANIDTYRKIISNRRNSANKENIKLTFFACHEYNDYSLTNGLYLQGHEIAVHSISHESNTDLWREASEQKLRREMGGMRTMLSTFGYIPPQEVVGHRAPFLQTAGNITFTVLSKEGFLYDSSMPSRNFMTPPVWPYTLDYGFAQDCQIEPCPTGKDTFPGLWMVPMIQYLRQSKEGDFYCSMVDACTPQPVTAADTKDFLMENFLRHYRSTKAPFPVFLHEGWLRDQQRLNGYLQFLDEILRFPDVFVASIHQVVEYMRNPVSYQQYVARHQQPPTACNNAEVCSYKDPLRIMKSCSRCPKYYPWVGTPLGKRPPKDFPTYD